jgi:hypothetical protein
MDNGFTERAIRKFAIGRNNWMFSDTVEGANASALLYSLVITAKVNGVNPYAALVKIFTEILSCRAEDLKLRTSTKISKLISIFCVLGWRVFWMTMMNRDIEDAPAEIALTDEETAILDHIFPPKKKHQSLSDYIIKVARLGGYLAHSSDPPPGNLVMWRGMRKLTEIHLGIEIGRNFVGN